MSEKKVAFGGSVTRRFARRREKGWEEWFRIMDK